MSDKTTAKLNTWIDDTKYPVPAQCYYYFKNSKSYYCIYLRWRHSDPWSASLIKFKDETLDWDECDWCDLKVKEYKFEELNKLKRSAKRRVKELLEDEDKTTKTAQRGC